MLHDRVLLVRRVERDEIDLAHGSKPLPDTLVQQ